MLINPQVVRTNILRDTGDEEIEHIVIISNLSLTFTGSNLIFALRGDINFQNMTTYKLSIMVKSYIFLLAFL
jgi:hypothetical protein